MIVNYKVSFQLVNGNTLDVFVTPEGHQQISDWIGRQDNALEIADNHKVVELAPHSVVARVTKVHTADQQQQPET